MLTSSERITRGANRAALIVGGVCGGWFLLASLLEIARDGAPSGTAALFWLGVALAAFLVPWASVRVIGWIVAGFARDRADIR